MAVVSLPPTPHTHRTNQEDTVTDQFADDFAPHLAEQLRDPDVRAAYEAEQTSQESTVTDTNPLNTADRLAPAPETRDDATKHAWVRHYAAQALAALAVLNREYSNLPPNPEPGSRPDIGYLSLLAQSSMAAAVAFLGPIDAPTLLWDLTPEAGALNGEWEEWLVEVLVRYGVNPGYIDPAYDPDDFTEALAAHAASNQPYVCPDCGETAYLHFPECAGARS
ncbi:hypothetical protein ACFOOK_28205 [Micromonospora krabiensis]|uniref:Uncharacterized protein n=1 Tax=Micromonospora krabiensis TaxID=307121 RepID=A0A1C3N4P1_9ACTN|nr:hypothetical protein [Micromonospora krabiensis]SBV27547.1 hypothetical protein GA0070620_3071 [Micromonospora krabiensis]